MSVVDNAIYAGGHRMEPESLDQTYDLLRQSGGMGWIGLYRPDDDEIRSVAREFSLHELAVEDAVHAHQRPKLERYGNTLFVVLRPARYVDHEEVVEIDELHVFVGPDFVVTIRHGPAPELKPVRGRLEGQPDLLKMGPEAVLYAIMDQVVDDYQPVLRGLQHDLDEIETEVFGGEIEVSRRVYQLSREVIEFDRACRPLVEVLDALMAGFDKYAVDLELRRLLRDVRDHAVRVAERVDSFRQLLGSMLTVNSALVAQRQNEEMKRLSEASFEQNEQVKRISGWAAIIFAPTLVGTVYGMNFASMPELDWAYGYPFALGLMFVVGLILYAFFKIRGWL
ncbi:magnesium and cobalt transport protein CorA [Actinopolymorpha sp. B11F2]|uniref:magnesium and cobalt transport protein CorA n=1 Tax=Actinopolymorpha sp. B11F2 TaxID=3160862 RepID=UPI0032E38FD3